MNLDLEVPNYDFDVVSRKTKTVWHFTPSQAQFRNGAVEIFVRKFNPIQVRGGADSAPLNTL